MGALLHCASGPACIHASLRPQGCHRLCRRAATSTRTQWTPWSILPTIAQECLVFACHHIWLYQAETRVSTKKPQSWMVRPIGRDEHRHKLQGHDLGQDTDMKTQPSSWPNNLWGVYRTSRASQLDQRPLSAAPTTSHDISTDQDK